MNAVIIDGDVSYPPTSGKRLRTLHLMLRLAQRHSITYIARRTSQNDDVRLAREYLGDHGITSVIVDDPLPRKQGVGFLARLAANMLSPLPYSVATHQSQQMKQAVQDIARRQNVDLWQLEWSAYLPTLKGIPGTRKLLIAHNVDSLIWQRYYKNEQHSLKRAYIKGQWHKFERFERWAFAEADEVVAVSADDAVLVREQFGQPRVGVVENGIDRAYFEGVARQPHSRQVLFLGALDWRPNQDAIDVLLRDVLPALRAKVPDVELCVVGRNPSAALVARLKAEPGVTLHSDVPDVRPFLASSAMMAVPLRIGGGSRLKILEALATGLPVVSTTVGAEGLDLADGKEITLADTPQAMADALADALQRPQNYRDQAARGRQLVLEQYDWDSLAAKLEGCWDRCVLGPLSVVSSPSSLATHN